MGRLGSNLKKIRLSSGMTQSKLAKKAGLTEETLSLIENGHQKNPQLATIKKICAALKCKATDLLGK